MKQKLDQRAENRTTIVTALTSETDKFRNYVSAWHDRCHSGRRWCALPWWLSGRGGEIIALHGRAMTEFSRSCIRSWQLTAHADRLAVLDSRSFPEAERFYLLRHYSTFLGLRRAAITGIW
jgi:hypothetical protein